MRVIKSVRGCARAGHGLAVPFTAMARSQPWPSGAVHWQLKEVGDAVEDILVESDGGVRLGRVIARGASCTHQVLRDVPELGDAPTEVVLCLLRTPSYGMELCVDIDEEGRATPGVRLSL